MIKYQRLVPLWYDLDTGSLVLLEIWIANILVASSILDSIVVSIPARHAGDRGSIPRRGGSYFFSSSLNNKIYFTFFLRYKYFLFTFATL